MNSKGSDPGIAFLDHRRMATENGTGQTSTPPPPPATPYLTVNRMAFSMSTFNQTFRRLSQLSGSLNELNLAQTARQYYLDSCSTDSGSKSSLEQRRQQQQRQQRSRWIRSRWRALSGAALRQQRSVPRSSSADATLNEDGQSRSLICKLRNPMVFVQYYFPIFRWLGSEYNVGHSLMSDLVAGLTMAVFHIPECKFERYFEDFVQFLFCSSQQWATAFWPKFRQAIVCIRPSSPPSCTPLWGHQRFVRSVRFGVESGKNCFVLILAK